MRIAVVGSGISGLLAARLLSADHEIVVFEAADRVGGHTHTRPVERNGGRWNVDSGFIVFNHRTYPNLTRMFELLGVETRESSMTFSVRNRRSGLEWCGTNLDTLFAQRRNLLSVGFLRMVRDVLRFNREGPELIPTLDPRVTLGEVLERGGYGRRFIDDYIVPMGAAIWSSEPRRMLAFPALTFLRFFDNHGMLSVSDRPVWRTVVGGSRAYLDPLVEPFRDGVRVSSPVTSVRRLDDGGVVVTAAGASGGRPERFDEVVLALHSNQALSVLDDASAAEREILGALPYQRNEAVLHVDDSVLPRSSKARAAWNYVVPERERDTVSVTYDMNTLQGLDAPERFLLTLNPCEPIDPEKVIERLTYHHPIFDAAGIAAQARRDEIDGQRHTHYCGAYWRHGFHEDGVLSALHVTRRFGVDGIDGVTRTTTPRAAAPSAAATSDAAHAAKVLA